MRKLLLTAILLLGCFSEADQEKPKDFVVNKVETKDTIRIAVIDTGFDFNSSWNTEKAKANNLVKPKLCSDGHKDFVDNDNKPDDNHGHGTHVAGIIARRLQNIDYCLIILKYYTPGYSGDTGTANLRRSNLALLEALKLKVNYINYSGGGVEPDNMERVIVGKILSAGIKLFAAAGNERSDLDDKPYYPALYDDRVFVAGATDNDGRIIASSNRGRGVDRYLLGKDVVSLLPRNQVGPMTGTSQATPLYLTEVVLEEDSKNKN